MAVMSCRAVFTSRSDTARFETLDVSSAGASHLVGEEQRLEGERVFERADGHDVRLRSQHESTDPDHSRALHRSKEERVRLLGTHPADRPDVIALLVEDGVDVCQIDEFLDLDRPAPLGSDRDELVVGDRDKVAAGKLEPSHNVASLDRLRGRGRRGRGRLEVLRCLRLVPIFRR